MSAPDLFPAPQPEGRSMNIITRENVTTLDPHGNRVFGHRVITCPDCGHGIDPHGVDPGGTCGVGDEHANPCPCLMTPNGIACLVGADA